MKNIFTHGIQILLFCIYIILTGCGFFNSNEPDPERGSINSTTSLLTIPNFLLQLSINSLPDQFKSAALSCASKDTLTFYKLNYYTIGVDNASLQTASTLVIIPKPYSKTSDKATLMLYLHGTISDRSQSPSKINKDDLATIQYAEGGLGFACSGLITVIPDYLGLGDDTSQIHPYLHGQSTASAAIDALRAAKYFLENDQSIMIDTNIYIAGFSQGGYSTLVTHHELQKNHEIEFTVKHSFPLSGPYDPDLMLTQLTSSKNYDGISFIPYAILSYLNAYNDFNDDISTIFNAKVAPIIETLYNMSNNTGTIKDRLIDTLGNSKPRELFNKQYLDNFNSNQDHILRQKFKVNNPYKWIPRTKMTFISCDNDEIVASRNAQIASESMIAMGANTNDIKLKIIEGSSHVDCAEKTTTHMLNHYINDLN